VRALQYSAIGKPPEVREIPKPAPRAGEVLLKVTAAGACHSDEFIMSLPAEAYTYGLPLTLGHEGAGIVAAVGAGVDGVKEGDSVAVYGPWGCGYCRACSTGAENYCENAAAMGITPPGLGSPGSMADYMIVRSPRHLVPLGDLDPVANVALTDAGLTPYHAIKPSLPKLVPGSTAVVIGAGGLGHVAIQMLRALSAARVVALDIGEDKLAFAKEVGAHEAFTSDAGAVERVRELTDGKGAEAVFDFVGIQPTAQPRWSASVPTSSWSGSEAAPSRSASSPFPSRPTSGRPTGARGRSSSRCSTWPARGRSGSKSSASGSRMGQRPTSGCTPVACAGAQ
jgi:propanol-preferring alcohol dehydrogenase